jgi:hypothetical protein
MRSASMMPPEGQPSGRVGGHMKRVRDRHRNYGDMILDCTPRLRHG